MFVFMTSLIRRCKCLCPRITVYQRLSSYTGTGKKLLRRQINAIIPLFIFITPIPLAITKRLLHDLSFHVDIKLNWMCNLIECVNLILFLDTVNINRDITWRHRHTVISEKVFFSDVNFLFNPYNGRMFNCSPRQVLPIGSIAFLRSFMAVELWYF